MRTRTLSAVTAASVAVLGLTVLAACSSSGHPVSKGTTVSGNVVQMDILGGTLSTKYGILAPDGHGHDTFVPAEFTAKAGVTYTIRVYNYDEGPHSFTIDSLGISKPIAPYVSATQPSVTTFKVQFPKAGVYRFYCKYPCDAKHQGWAMTKDRLGNGKDQDGFMAGYVNVISS